MFEIIKKRKINNILFLLNILFLIACSSESPVLNNIIPANSDNKKASASPKADKITGNELKKEPVDNAKPENNINQVTKPQAESVNDPDSVPEVKEIIKETKGGLKVDTNLIKYGIDNKNIFIERANKKFQPGENIVIISPVSGLKATNNFVIYNENIIIKKDNKEIYNKQNIFGNNGNILEFGSDSSTASLQIRTNMTLPDTFKGNLTISVKITDWNDKTKTAVFEANISLE